MMTDERLLQRSLQASGASKKDAEVFAHNTNRIMQVAYVENAYLHGYALNPNQTISQQLPQVITQFKDEKRITCPVRHLCV